MNGIRLSDETPERDPSRADTAQPEEIESSAAETHSIAPETDDATRSLSTKKSSRLKMAGDSVELGAMFGRYRIEQKIGKGGMGSVYVARDTKLDRRVALKIPFFDESRRTEAIQRFLREAQAMATMHHPNLCPVYDAGETEGIHYLTMALIEGQTLADRLRRETRFSTEDSIALVHKLAQALSIVHTSGIVHRDLKPANIMLGENGEPVIMDFGLAQRVREGEHELTQAGAILGTPAYMAPEQVRGDTSDVGPATDVYALGVILYQLLTGQLPFVGSLGNILVRIATEDPPLPTSINSQLDPRVEAVCLKAMARNIADRYASAGELERDLGQLVNKLEAHDASSQSIPFTSTPYTLHGRQKLRRYRWALLSAAAILGASITIAIIANQPDRAEPTREQHVAIGDNRDGNAVLDQTETESLRDELDQGWRLPPDPRRYPSSPDAISSSPPWLVDDPDAPFDIAKHFQLPVWEDNAGPLYVDALYEFSHEVETWFPEADRQQRTPVVLRREQSYLQLFGQLQTKHDAVDSASIEAALREFERGFEKLVQAQRKRECVFDIGVGVAPQLAPVMAARHVARLTCMQVWSKLQRHDVSGALEHLAVTLRMSRDLNRDGSLYAVLTNSAISNLMYDRVLDILHDKAISSTDCGRLVVLLNEHALQSDDAIQSSLRHEYIVFRVNLHDIQFRFGDYSAPSTSPGELFFNLAPGSSDEGQLNRARRIDEMTAADFANEVAIANRGFASLLSIFKQPIYERHRSVSRLWDQTSRNPDSRVFRYTMPTLLATFDAYRRERTSLSALICLAAIRRWQLQHDANPPNLDSCLANIGITEPILDPYGIGTPLRMTFQDGWPVVYSVGPDGNDDQAQSEWSPQRPSDPSDVIFRLSPILK